MKLMAVILLVAVSAVAETPPPALTRETKSLTAYQTHLSEQRATGTVRWYSMMNGSLWVARDDSGRVVEEWDRYATGTWRERRTGRTIRQVSTSWRSDNGDTLRRDGSNAEIRNASGFRVNTVRRVP